MRILLATLNAKYIHVNLAIRLLYSLNRSHKGLAWKEFTIKENGETIADYCKDFEVVCFSCYIWNISQTLAVCKAIKERSPHTKILLGGPEVSYEWEQVLLRDEVDYIIVGEGEIPFSDFVQRFPRVDNIPGLAYKYQGAIHFTPSGETFDLKNYTDIMPYAFDEPESIQNRVAYIETSRGCPYKCEFCLASLDNKVRYLPDAHIKNTLLYLMKHGKVVKFLDRTFNMKRDFTLDIFRFILHNYQPGNVFQFEITADILHPDIIKFIQDEIPKGLFRFEIGIQTVNQQANLAVSRRQNFEKTRQIIKSIEMKVELHLDLIIGLAHDYWDDIKFSFNEVFALKAPELQLGFLKFLKGTPVRNKSNQFGFVFQTEPPYQIIESQFLSRSELLELQKLEHALELYWNKGRARNTLNYVIARYDSFDFLLKLGQFFYERVPALNYTLYQVYDVLMDFVCEVYPDDANFTDLAALDYYLHYKVKPKVKYRNEIDRNQKNDLIYSGRFNHYKFRYLIIPIRFSALHFRKTGEINESPVLAVIRYDGVKSAVIEAELSPVAVKVN